MGDTEAVADILTPALLRNLTDRQYDRRKAAALEIEAGVKAAVAQPDMERVGTLLDFLSDSMAKSTDSNVRKGALIALAAVAIGLGSNEAPAKLGRLLPPIVAAFVDEEPRVRYYAAESLYNIAKVVRGAILEYFNDVFDALCKVSADLDGDVKNGASLLDRLIKDIVTETSSVPLDAFIPLLQDRIYVISPFVRAFLLGWLSVLDSVPDIDLIPALPSFLDGLLIMLSDGHVEIRKTASDLLAELLDELREDPGRVNIPALTSIVLPYVVSEDDLTASIALQWTSHFLLVTQHDLLPHLGDILRVVLPVLAHPVASIQAEAQLIDSNLCTLVRETDAGAIMPGVAAVIDELVSLVLSNPTPLSGDADRVGGLASGSGTELSRRFSTGSLNAKPSRSSPAVQAVSGDRIIRVSQDLLEEDADPDLPLTRLAALKWIAELYAKAPAAVIATHRVLFPALMRTLRDGTDAVVSANLDVLARLSSGPGEAQFPPFISALAAAFSADRALFATRWGLILRGLATLLGAEKVYRAWAAVIVDKIQAQSGQVDPFYVELVHRLHLILLTAPELSQLRTSIKMLEGDLFPVLYRSWSVNPVATLSLCLLPRGAHEHSAALIDTFAELPMTAQTLLELDELVAVLESPVFAHVRLALLNPVQSVWLIKTLYGVLMLLPQSKAYETLQNRLTSLTTLHYVSLVPGSPFGSGEAFNPSSGSGLGGASSVSISKSSEVDVPWADLLGHFRSLHKL